MSNPESTETERIYVSYTGFRLGEGGGDNLVLHDSRGVLLTGEDAERYKARQDQRMQKFYKTLEELGIQR